MCVLTENGPRWVFACCAKSYLEYIGRNRMGGSTAGLKHGPSKNML